MLTFVSFSCCREVTEASHLIAVHPNPHVDDHYQIDTIQLMV